MIQLRRFYSNGNSISHIITDLIHESVKIQGLGFKNIKLIPYNRALKLDNISELSDIMWHRPEGKFNEHQWLTAIEHNIESMWNPSKINLVMHSSGYDSRVVSHFLRRVYNKNPGRILFVCIEPESIQFKKIMKYQGWDESQWVIYDRYTDPFNLMSDFITAYEGLDGVAEFPVNVSMACIKYLQITEKLPKDLSNVVLWSGIHMNELFKSTEALSSAINFSYLHRITPIWGLGCSMIIAPILSIRSLKVIFSKSRAKNFRWRDHLVKMLDPKLAKIDKTYPSTGQNISSSAANRMINDFKSSYYYKYVNQISIPKITHSHKPIENRKFWRVWTFASLVDHLLKNGVKIK